MEDLEQRYAELGAESKRVYDVASEKVGLFFSEKQECEDEMQASFFFKAHDPRLWSYVFFPFSFSFFVFSSTHLFVLRFASSRFCLSRRCT